MPKKITIKKIKKKVKNVDCPACYDSVPPLKLRKHLIACYYDAEREMSEAEGTMWEISDLYKKKFKKNIEDET